MTLEELRAEIRRIEGDREWAHQRKRELERGFVEYCRLHAALSGGDVGRCALSMLQTTMVHVHAQNTLGEGGGPYPEILENRLSLEAIRHAHDIRGLADAPIDEVELMRLQDGIGKGL